MSPKGTEEKELKRPERRQQIQKVHVQHLVETVQSMLKKPVRLLA